MSLQFYRSKPSLKAIHSPCDHLKSPTIKFITTIVWSIVEQVIWLYHEPSTGVKVQQIITWYNQRNETYSESNKFRAYLTTNGSAYVCKTCNCKQVHTEKFTV